MKSKLRRITVNERVFLWRVVPLDAEYIAVRIWAPDQKSVPWIQVRYKHHNQWLYYGEIISAPDMDKVREVFQLEPITPKYVKAMIQQAITADPDVMNAVAIKKTRSYDWEHEMLVNPPSL